MEASYIIISLIVGELINEIVEKNFTIIYNCIYDYDTYVNITSIERTVKTNEYVNLPSLQTFVYNLYNEFISYTIDGVTYQVSYNNGNPNKYKDYNLTFANGNLTLLANTDIRGIILIQKLIYTTVDLDTIVQK